MLMSRVQIYELLFALNRVRRQDLPHLRTPCVARLRHVAVMVTFKAVYQAFKFMTTNPRVAELIRTQPSARAARKEAGFQRAHQRSDWFEMNVEAMYEILHAKFIQHDDLRVKLLETGDRELIEDSPVRFSVLSLCHS